MSFLALAIGLNGRGVPGAGGFTGRHPGRSQWSTDTVRDILENPVYCGAARWGVTAVGKYHRMVNGELRPTTGKRTRRQDLKGAVVRHDGRGGIVDRETFDRVQAKIDARRRGKYRPRRGGYALGNGLLCCGHCGGKMQGETVWGETKRDRRPYAYYLCDNAKRKGASACRRYSIREDRILPFLVRKLQRKYLTPDKLERLRAELWEQVRSECRPDRGQAERLRAALADKDAEIRRATQNALRATANIDLLQDALSELRRRRDQLARELEPLERALDATPEELGRRVEDAVVALYGLRERLAEADPARLREVLRQMIVRVELYFDDGPRKSRQWHRFQPGIIPCGPGSILHQ